MYSSFQFDFQCLVCSAKGSSSRYNFLYNHGIHVLTTFENCRAKLFVALFCFHHHHHHYTHILCVWKCRVAMHVRVSTTKRYFHWLFLPRGQYDFEARKIGFFLSKWIHFQIESAIKSEWHYKFRMANSSRDWLLSR